MGQQVRYTKEEVYAHKALFSPQYTQEPGNKATPHAKNDFTK